MEEITRQAIEYAWMNNLIFSIGGLLGALAITIYLMKGHPDDDIRPYFLIFRILCLLGFAFGVWGNICLVYWPKAVAIKGLLGK